jgi:phosphoribosylformylglycinamidine synthase
MFKIEVSTRKGFKDSRGEHILSDILGLGIKAVTKVDYAPVYFIEGGINMTEAKTIASELLSDKIIENYTVSSKPSSGEDKSSVIEVLYKKGVTDTVAESVVKAIKDLGITKKVEIKTGHKYCFHGNLSRAILDKIASKLLANTLVQEYNLK